MEEKSLRETYMFNREQLVAIVNRLDIKLLALELKWDRLAELLDEGASIHDDEVDSLVRKISLRFRQE